MKHLRSVLSVSCLMYPCLLFANAESVEVLQPVESPSGLAVVTDAAGTHVVSESGQAQQIPLRGGETLTNFVELKTGWIGAGFSQTNERNRLVFYSDGASGIERLREPNADSNSALGSFHPTLLVKEQQLEGVAWLEGDGITSMAVRAALWSGLEWGAPEEVAAPGPGSQTGLTGAVLQDGSWLLAWARYDGTDDEIYWSRREGETWSEPKRVDAGNNVPDVTPHLVATEGGALLAWSRFDGNEYRLALSRFQGDGWESPHYAAPPGSLAPQFSKRGDKFLLSYRETSPRAWIVIELNPSGRALRQARVDYQTKVRPIVKSEGRSNFSLEWPGSEERHSLRWENIP